MATRSLAELGVLTARWLEGDINLLPAFGAAGPDPETDDLIEILAAVNRAGFMTTFSQPGMPDADGWCQRAAVEGFCDKRLADRIVKELAGTDLVVLRHGPGATEEVRVPVTLNDARAYSWVPNPFDTETIWQSYADSCGPAAIEDLARADQVCIFDAVWGRNDLLWRELGRVIGFTASTAV
jgi:hypothetical protein